MKKWSKQFELTLPDSWEDKTTYNFMSPEIAGIRHNLRFTTDQIPETTDINQYGRKKVDRIVADQPNLVVIKEKIKTVGEGIPAYDAVFKKSAEEGGLIIKHTYILCKDTGLTFTVELTEDKYETLGNEIDKIIGSFSSSLA